MIALGNRLAALEDRAGIEARQIIEILKAEIERLEKRLDSVERKQNAG